MEFEITSESILVFFSQDILVSGPKCCFINPLWSLLIVCNFDNLIKDPKHSSFINYWSIGLTRLVNLSFVFLSLRKILTNYQKFRIKFLSFFSLRIPTKLASLWIRRTMFLLWTESTDWLIREYDERIADWMTFSWWFMMLISKFIFSYFFFVS